MSRRGRARRRADPALEAVLAGWAAVRAHPLFAPMTHRSAQLLRQPANACPPDGWAVVDAGGTIHVHPTRLATPEQWTWVFAHLLLHLGFEHLDASTSGGRTFDAAHVAACDVVVNRFLGALRLGHPVLQLPSDPPSQDEAVLAGRWRAAGVPAHLTGGGTGGSAPDLVGDSDGDHRHHRDPVQWQRLFAAGLAEAVVAAVDVAGGARASLSGGAGPRTEWAQALSWFVSSYPLLGSVASVLTLVDDPALARAHDIQVAAVDAAAGEVYVNPHAGLGVEEWRFVLAHEMLHAALDHAGRRGGRDALLWNVAADFVINGWLVEMGVGQMPDGLLHDPQLRGLSAEAVYDRIVTDARRYRKLATLRGPGLRDVLGEPLPGRRAGVGGIDLDEYYRRSLTQGLEYHVAGGRGLLPAGLVEQIRALEAPVLPWDAQLARWFEEHVPGPRRTRSYLRPSRRQSATPDIPRPGWAWPTELQQRFTFGVVLDTSGSMDRVLLGRALGTIASYATARDVPLVRLVFCDAVAYDAGYVPVEDIAGRVRVRGRGGTVLQPGVDLLERAGADGDFPREAPVLVITDGECDHVRFRGGREHAYVLPQGRDLPFVPRGPVFRVRP